MSNHSSDWPKDDLNEFDRIIREEAAELKLGATQQFPLGKITPSDEGELRFAVASDPANGAVVISFGKPVAWLAMTARNARDLAEVLVKRASELA